MEYSTRIIFIQGTEPGRSNGFGKTPLAEIKDSIERERRRVACRKFAEGWSRGINKSSGAIYPPRGNGIRVERDDRSAPRWIGPFFNRWSLSLSLSLSLGRSIRRA